MEGAELRFVGSACAAAARRRPGLQLGGIARPGNRRSGGRAENENDYENEERGTRTRTIEGGRVAHGIHGIHGMGGGRWEEKENDYENEERGTIFLGAGGRAAGAEMAGREPLSRGAGDGGK